MKCSDIQYIIDEIGDLDRLPPEAARHVDACRACERFGLELVSLRSLLREPGRMQAPADFDLRLARRLREARQTPARRPFLAWLATPRHGLAAAAAAALLVTGGLAVSRVATDEVAPAQLETAVVAPEPAPSPSAATPPADPPTGESTGAGFVAGYVSTPRGSERSQALAVRASTTRRQTAPRRAEPHDAMILVSDERGTHMVSVPAVLVGAEQILPTVGAAPASAGVAF